MEGHYGTTEAWYDYLDYCYWVDCNPDGTTPGGSCNYECGISPECDEKEPGTGCCYGCYNVDFNDDEIVDIHDVVIPALVFGSYPGHPRWDSRADLNLDNYVDWEDLSAITDKYGTSCEITCADYGGFCDHTPDCKDGWHCYCSNCLDCTEWGALCCCVPTTSTSTTTIREPPPWI